MGHLKSVLVLLAWFLVCVSASEVSDTDVCPKFLVSPGDTLSSISVQTGFDVYSISVSVESCGKRTSPLSVGVICLPGGEYPGCNHVGHFRMNGKCPYYVVQSSDTLDQIAQSVNIYVTEVEKVNKGTIFEQLAPQDLLKLPPWDEAVCGDDFPKTEQELASLPPAPPPPLQGDSTVVGNAVGDGNLVTCDAYRIDTGDTIFSVAATFGIPVSMLMDSNPDIAGGAPLVSGVLVKLSDEKQCDRYEILDGLADITASLAQPPPAPPPPPPGPRQVGLVTDENPMIYNEIMNDDLEEYYSIDIIKMEEGSSDATPIFQNVVSDQVPDVEGSSGPGIGVYIMIGCLGFLLLMVLIMMSIAISNSTKKHGNQEKRRTPIREKIDDGESSTASGSSSSKEQKITDDDSV